MSTSSEVTIVIPAKNEAQLLPILLTSLARQDYPAIRSTKTFIADANSSDGTPDIARSFADRLDIEVIPGGLPAVGRNAGAARATTPYVLFLDADMELPDPTLLRRSLEHMKRRGLHCLTTHIWCRGGDWMDQILYAGSNLTQYSSCLINRPFATGMYMLFDKHRFEELGGFHEKALYAEDYLLSKKVGTRRFGIVRGTALTTNRRFRKMGHFHIVGLFLKTAVNSFDDNYFLRDQHYWHS